MRSASLNPWVMTKSVGSPLRSSNALVATVVPIFTHSTSSGVTASPDFKPSKWRIPATAASLYCSGFSLSSLWVTKVPSGFLPTTSVNVPPRSIQNCQRLSIDLFCIVIFYIDAAARAAWSYTPDSTRSKRANSPISLFRASSAFSALMRHCSRIAR